MEPHIVISWAGITAVVGGISAIIALCAVVVPWVRRLSEMIDDWTGVPDRPGVSGRDGVMVRLDKIETALKDNGLSTAKDRQRQIDVLMAINEKIERVINSEGHSESED